MKCPFCGFNNISGADECESCHEDLASIDGVVPKTPMEKVLMSDTLERIAPRKPVLVSKDASVFDAVKSMNAGKVGCALVGTPDRLEGILTERDVVLKGVCLDKDLEKTPVAALMTPSPEILTEEDTLAYAVNKMAVGGYRHIPIVEGRRPMGVISIRDVLRYLSKSFP